jgi:Beta-propeller repeat
VTGETASSDFPSTPGAFRTTRNVGAPDAYVTKLNATGSALLYSTFLGGTQVDFGVRIAVDASNNAYVVGNTSSTDFPTTAGAFDTSQNGGFDVFVTKLNAAGSGLLYSTFLGGAGFDSPGGLAIDSAGNAYVSGGTSSADFPVTPGAFQTVSQSSGGGGGFVTKLNATGSALVFSTFLGDAGVNGIALAPTGNMWVTGGTTSLTFPTTPDAFQGFLHAGAAPSDAFITELNSTGSAIVYSTYLGGGNTDYGTDVKLDSAGNVYITGETLSSDFPTTPNAFDRVFKGELDIFWGDAFITKLALNGTPPPPPPLPTVASVTGPFGVVAGNSAAITVSLTSGAQGTGAVITLTSSNPAILSVPANLTIPTGGQTGTVTAATSAVTVNTPVTVTASYNNSSQSITVTVQPVPPPGVLSSIGFFPNSITGGTAALAIIGLSNPAGPSGLTATLSANVPNIVTLPATITVPPGQTTVSFSVPTAVVATQTGLTVFAVAGGVQQLAPLFVNPAAPPPPPTVTLSVSATGRSGQTVTSSPAGINAATGSSSQAAFASGTSIKLSVSGGRTAIWSGACSANKTASCTFTLNGAASVAANVQ